MRHCGKVSAAGSGSVKKIGLMFETAHFCFGQAALHTKFTRVEYKVTNIDLPSTALHVFC